ncbi:tetratricopeptide repeat protein [Clostridium sp. DL1XJH146]
MLKTLINTMDKVNKVVVTIDKVATTANEVSTAINNTTAVVNNISNALGKSNNLDKTATTMNKISNTANIITGVIDSIVSSSDMDYLSQQSTANLNNILAEMTGLMNDNNNKIKGLESQTWYQRMIKTVNKKNKSTENGIRRNHDELNTYMSEAIAELYNRNCIDHRIMISLGNQLNKLYIEHIELKEMLGAFVTKLNEKIDSIDNFNMLNLEITQGRYSNFSSLEAVFIILTLIDKRTLMDKRKMDIIEISLRNKGIINDNKVKLKDYLMNIKSISQDNIGLIYMDQSYTRGNFMSNIILNIFDSQNLLLESKNEEKSITDIVKGFITKEKLDNNIELSATEIYNSLVQSKIDKINGLNPISPIQYEAMINEGQKAYLEYRMEDALNIFSVLAEKGVGRAKYFLGELYTHGYGAIEKDIEKSIFWRKSGYENNDELAYLNYGYISDHSVEQNLIFNEIFEDVLDLSKQGDIFAQNEIADMYYHGYGTYKDIKQYIYWLKAASEKGYFRAIMKLADCYYYGTGVNADYYTAYVLYKKAAEIGEQYCQNRMGNYYYNGEFKGQDYSEAVKWYKKSAEQGFHWGQSNLGNCYRDGKGVKQNYNEAFKWYLRAAENGNAYAQYEVAYCYKYGKGVKNSIIKANEWYEKAADNGNGNAMIVLGDYYNSSILKNKSKAFKFYKKAAELGFPRAQKELANCYRDGNGTKIDYKKAVEWYRKSAEQGYAPAMTNLGWAYSVGKGVNSDDNKAIGWYRKGAEAGSEVSQCVLAGCYYEGDIVRKNVDIAKKWYIKAAKQGDKDAIKALKKYYKITLKK